MSYAPAKVREEGYSLVVKPCILCGRDTELRIRNGTRPERICRPCKAHRDREWRKTNVSHRARDRDRYERRKLDPVERQKDRVRRRTRKAIAAGRLERQPCEVCGATAEAHHDDYDKPFDVRWLCPFHHNQHHVNERARANEVNGYGEPTHWQPLPAPPKETP